MKPFNAAALAHLFPKQAAGKSKTKRRARNDTLPTLPPSLHLRRPETIPQDETPEQRALADAAAMDVNRRRKHGNIICYDDDGNAYQSLTEAKIVLDFKQRYRDGFITEPKRGRYKFAHNGVDIGSYTSDLEFECLKTFHYSAPGGGLDFLAGFRYVCDVKSPATATKEYKRTRLLMQAFHGILITEIWTCRAQRNARRSAPRKAATKAPHGASTRKAKSPDAPANAGRAAAPKSTRAR